jgi:tryptophan synthase alpha chain
MFELESGFHHPPAFMPYFPVGYPSLPVSVDVIVALARGGADLIEVGVPFSDPLAAGPVIQRATQIALQQGATVAKCVEAAAELRRRGVTVPLVLMGYYNPLLAYGLPRLAQAAATAGASGFIVPDLPPEEAAEMEAALAPSGLPLVRMLAPTTPLGRAARIAAGAQGFIYLVSVTGTTGARSALPTDLPDFIARVRAAAPKGLPLCVGFGISTPAHARAVGELADGIIVGSACVKTIGEAADPVAAAEQFARDFKAPLEELAASLS